jgi:hypothetical protein
MTHASHICLTHTQITRLTQVCAASLHLLWQRQPTLTRNQLIQRIQRFQGRLDRIEEQDSGVPLSLNEEEMSVIRILSQLNGQQRQPQKPCSALATIQGLLYQQTSL